MLTTISHKTIILLIDDESIYLSMNLGTSHDLWCGVCHYDTFRKVLDVSSECMLKREELSMFVEQRILATLLQPNELQSRLAYWA
jgi:ubiquinone biosynthesis protein Coq4